MIREWFVVTVWGKAPKVGFFSTAEKALAAQQHLEYIAGQMATVDRGIAA